MEGFKYSGIYHYRGKKVLEVDILPGKYCNFDCVICPYEGPLSKQEDKAILGSVDSSLQELNWKLAEADVDEVFLNSKGEVLLSNCFDPVVDLIKRHGIAIRLMSNGYLLNSKDYRDTVNRIDEVVAEVDMTTESTYREIKRPLEHYSLKQYIKNLADFRKQYPGRLSLDIGILRGYNDDEGSIERLASFVREIKPDEISVYRCENKKFRERFAVSSERLTEVDRILNDALKEAHQEENAAPAMTIDGNETALAAFEASMKGDRKGAFELQEKFFGEFHKNYGELEDGDEYCPLSDDCPFKNKCRDCIAYHRGHMRQLPACMQPIIDRRMRHIVSSGAE